MTHFNDFDLRRWQEAGPGDDRDRIVAHVAECAECASKYAAAIKRAEFKPEGVSDAGKYVSAGYAVRGSRRWFGPAAAAAAAALVIAIAVPLMMRRNEQAHTLTLRGGSIQATVPNGAVDLRNPQFEWASGIAASRYRLEVGRGDIVLARTETQATQIPLPPQMLSRMKPGIEYWWQVTALDAEGKPVTQSARVVFFLPSR